MDTWDKVKFALTLGGVGVISGLGLYAYYEFKKYGGWEGLWSKLWEDLNLDVKNVLNPIWEGLLGSGLGSPLQTGSVESGGLTKTASGGDINTTNQPTLPSVDLIATRLVVGGLYQGNYQILNKDFSPNVFVLDSYCNQTKNNLGYSVYILSKTCYNTFFNKYNNGQEVLSYIKKYQVTLVSKDETWMLSYNAGQIILEDFMYIKQYII